MLLELTARFSIILPYNRLEVLPFFANLGEKPGIQNKRIEFIAIVISNEQIIWSESMLISRVNGRKGKDSFCCVFLWSFS